MATIKSYTDIEQSKKLAEILPLESADMYYKYVLPKSDRIIHTPAIGNPINSLKWYNEGYTFSGKRKPITLNDYCIPCWSLAALLNVLPEYNLQKICCGNVKVGDRIIIYPNDEHYISDYYSNPVDACYEMILKLNEQKIL